MKRLPPEYYRGHAFVHWNMALQNRATGWLTPAFHRRFREVNLHTLSRYHLLCLCYCLMPDHITENPVRKGVAATAREWPFSGSQAPGYPELDWRHERFTDRLWTVYETEVARAGRDVFTGAGSRAAPGIPAPIGEVSS